MHYSRAIGNLKKMLKNHGFKAKSPDPLVAWSAFKEFCELDVECDEEDIAFGCCLHPFLTGEYSFELHRRFFTVTAPGNKEVADLSIMLRCEPSEKLGADNLQLSTFKDKQAFFKAVEKSRQFKAVSKHKPWKKCIVTMDYDHEED